MTIGQDINAGGLNLGLLPALFLALSLASSVLYGVVFNRTEPSAIRTIVKTACVASLAVLAFLVGGAAFLVLGLIASALGDMFLGAPGERRFLLGVGSFALAHAAYVILFLQLGASPSALYPSHIAVLAIMLMASSFLIFRILWNRLGPMKLPLTGYFAIIMAMTILALSLPDNAGSAWIGLGAIAFALSDMTLGYELFVLDPKLSFRKFTSSAVWVLYIGAQLLITFGALKVLHLI